MDLEPLIPIFGMMIVLVPVTGLTVVLTAKHVTEPIVAALTRPWLVRFSGPAPISEP